MNQPRFPDSGPGRGQLVVWRVLVGVQLAVVLLVVAALLAIFLIGAFGPAYQQRAA